MTPIIVSKIWVGVSTNNINLLLFRSLTKRDFEYRCFRTHFEGNELKMFNITVIILLFSDKDTLTKLPS